MEKKRGKTQGKARRRTAKDLTPREGRGTTSAKRDGYVAARISKLPCWSTAASHPGCTSVLASGSSTIAGPAMTLPLSSFARSNTPVFRHPSGKPHLARPLQRGTRLAPARL